MIDNKGKIKRIGNIPCKAVISYTPFFVRQGFITRAECHKQLLPFFRPVRDNVGRHKSVIEHWRETNVRK